MFFLFLLGAFGTEITKIDIRFALMVQDMARRGIGLFPTVNGVEYGDYPSGWVLCSYLTTFGGRFVSLWLLALPGILAGTFSVFMTWMTGERLGKDIGLYAVAFLWITPSFLNFMTGFGIDLPVMAAGAVMLYWLQKNSSAGFLSGVFFVLLTFCFLTRGPMGVVLLGAGVGGYLLAERQWKKVVWCGIAGFGAVVLCGLFWYWAVHRQGGEALWNWFWESQFLSRMGKSDYTTYFVDHFLSLAPVTLAALCLFLFRRTRKLLKPLAGVIGYILLPMIILSIPACKHLRYMAIVLPGFALLAACAWNELSRTLPVVRTVVAKVQEFLKGRIGLLAAVAVSVLAGIGCFLVHPAFLPWGHLVAAVLLIAGMERFGYPEFRRFVPVAAVGIFLVVAVFPFAAVLENSQRFVSAVERDLPGKVYFYELGPDHDDLKYVLAVPPEKRHKIRYLYATRRTPRGFYRQMYPLKTLRECIAEITENDILILRDRNRERNSLREEAELHKLTVELKHSGTLGHREFIAVRLVRPESGK